MYAFVLGNGQSRSGINLAGLPGPIYGCNRLYQDWEATVLVATDREMAQEIQDSGYARHHRFYTRRPAAGTGAQRVPQRYFGFSSGPIAMALACDDHYRRLYLLGFDMGPTAQGLFNNVYADQPLYRASHSQPTFTGNWQRQIMTVARDYEHVEFWRVHGETTREIPELSELHNWRDLPIGDFLRRINNPEEL